MRAHHLFYPICIVTALSLAAPLTRAQDTSSALRAAVDAAWQRSPQARSLEARRDETRAGREAAQTWIAGSPAIGLSQRTDRWTDQNGARETEVSVSAPVWLPGQKTARQSMAQSTADDLEAQIIQARLVIAGEVRERLWAVASAREALTEAQDHQHHLEGIAEEVGRRVKAGDLARTDGMLAQQEVLAAQGAVASAQLRLTEAMTRYRLLTGQTDIPAADPEPLTSSMRDPHPRLLAATAAMQRAQAYANVTNTVRSDPPTVGLSMRREQDRSTVGASRSVGVAIQIPIGTNARNRPLETAAHTQLVSATAEAAQVDLVLRAEIEQARQQLQTSQEALAAATARAALTREHTDLIGKAFRLGERGLGELLRAEALSHEADIAQRQQRVAVGLAHARLNQALGIMP
jgi:outer membrane protein TolC